MESIGASKDLHIETCLRAHVETGATNGFERYRLQGDLPDFSFDEIDTSSVFLGKKLRLPLLISSLTGGGHASGRINRHLAEAAQALGIPMAVGSQRLMLEHPEAAESFVVRRFAPDIPLLANLGLVHFNYGLTREQCCRAVDAIGADALFLYVNPMQEVFQKGGSTNFRGLLEKLARFARSFPHPIFVKEVGHGFSESALRRLADIKLAGVDVAGKGGTNWALVEEAMGGTRSVGALAELGVSTAEALECAVRVLPPSMSVLASGGIRNGVEMAKAVAMGARLAGMGLPFLEWASESPERVIKEVERLEDEFRVSMWHVGARTLADLKGRVASLL